MCQLEERNEDSPGLVEQPMLQVISRRDGTLPPLEVQGDIDQVSVCMEVDTGASLSIMSGTLIERLWPKRTLVATDVRLCTYLKEAIQVLGCATVQMHYEGQSAHLNLIVVEGDGPTLLGRNWLF